MRRILLLILFLFLPQLHAKLSPGSVIYGLVPCLAGESCIEDSSEKLDWLASQGVDVVWISPIFPSEDDSLISYSVTDYFGINPSFGTKQNLKQFIKKAHSLGLKVMVDFVPNHSSDKHPFVLDILKKGKGSQFYNYYARTEEGAILTHEWWPDLYYLNYQEPALASYMEKAFTYWVDTFDVDGFRIDAAWELKNRAPKIFPKIIEKVEKKKDLIWLAEADGADPYYQKAGYDLGYDWKDTGIWSWEDVFTSEGADTLKLKELLLRGNGGNKVLRFINNNDTGDRFITKFGAHMARLAAVLQFTLPGTPLVYMGDMSGEEFDPYLDPKALELRDARGLFSLYKKLASLKATEASLQERELSFQGFSCSEKVLCFSRGRNNEISVLINFSGVPEKGYLLREGAEQEIKLKPYDYKIINHAR